MDYAWNNVCTGNVAMLDLLEPIFQAVMAFLFAIYMIMLVILVVILAYQTICYVFRGIGLSVLARNKGMQNGYLAFIPFAGYWLMGAMADDYRFRTEGKKTHRGVSLLVASIVPVVFWLLRQSLGISKSFLTETLKITAVEVSTVSFVLMCVALVFYLVYLVVKWIVLYDIFSFCVPKKKVLYLILSVLFGIDPFIIYACRNCVPEEPEAT